MALVNMRLSLRKKLRGAGEAYAWLRKSAAPTIATLFKASSGDLDFFMGLVKDGSKRLTKKHIMMLEEYENPGKYNHIDPFWLPPEDMEMDRLTILILALYML